MCGLEINNLKFMGIASHQLKSILVDALEKGRELDQIINLLSCTRDSDSCFDFRVGRNMDGKVIALCWQDGVMQGHCQAGLLDVVMLDMMKRQRNTVDWPYCGPILITGENKIACACDGIGSDNIHTISGVRVIKEQRLIIQVAATESLLVALLLLQSKLSSA